METLYAVVELVLVAGVLLGFALREILVLKREARRRAAEAAPDEKS